MGNFYGNIVLRGPDAAAVASALEELDFNGWIASEGNATVVYDEKCDQQDIGALKKLATALSDTLGCPALAFNNHDDSVLWFALAESGRIVDEYDSAPGYFDGDEEAAMGGDADRLCSAFGAPKQVRAVETLLRQSSDEVDVEVERHEELLRLLGLSPRLGLLGYGSVKRGALAQHAPDVELRAVGRGTTGDSATPSDPSFSGVEKPGVNSLRAVTAPSEECARACNGLLGGTVVVLPQLQPVLGSGEVPGYAALFRAAAHIGIHGSVDARENQVTAGGILCDLLGSEPIGLEELPIVAIRSLHVVAGGKAAHTLATKPFTVEEVAMFLSMMQAAIETPTLAEPLIDLMRVALAERA